MTNEEIVQIASSYLRELWSGDIGDVVWQPLEEDALLKFAQEIRKQTIDEILTTLGEVPNPEANRTAINRVMSI